MQTTNDDLSKTNEHSVLAKLASNLERFIFPPSISAAAFGSLVIAALVLLTTVDVVLRYFFNMPWVGTFELTEFMMSVYVASFLAYCGVKGKHVRLPLFVNRFPRRIRATIVTLTFFISSCFCATICWACIVYGSSVQKSGEYGTMTHTPVYFFVYAVGVGMGLLSLVWLITTIRNLGEAIKK